MKGAGVACCWVLVRGGGAYCSGCLVASVEIWR